MGNNNIICIYYIVERKIIEKKLLVIIRINIIKLLCTQLVFRQYQTIK